MGVFYPFMRTHTTFGTPDQEPWSYGPRHEEINRRAIELRYELLPAHLQRHGGGEPHRPARLPPAAPRVPGGPRDLRARRRVPVRAATCWWRPVLREGATEREVYLPKGDWYDFWTGTAARGRHGDPRPGDAGRDPDLRARGRLRLPAARRPAHGRDAGPAADRGRLPGRRGPRRRSTRTTGDASPTARRHVSRAAVPRRAARTAGRPCDVGARRRARYRPAAARPGGRACAGSGAERVPVAGPRRCPRSTTAARQGPRAGALVGRPRASVAAGPLRRRSRSRRALTARSTARRARIRCDAGGTSMARTSSSPTSRRCASARASTSRTARSPRATRPTARRWCRLLNEALATEIVCVLRYKRHYFMATGHPRPGRGRGVPRSTPTRSRGTPTRSPSASSSSGARPTSTPRACSRAATPSTSRARRSST